MVQFPDAGKARRMGYMNSRGSPVRGEGSDRFWPQQADLLGPTAGPRRESRSHQEKLTAAGRKRRGKSDCAWGPCPPRAVNTGCPPAGGVCLFIPYSKFLLQGLSKLGDSLGARPGAGSLFRDCPAASHISTAGAVPVRGGGWGSSADWPGVPVFPGEGIAPVRSGSNPSDCRPG